MNLNPLLPGLELSRNASPFAIYVFGVTGDLTRKKLIPALFSLYLKGNITTFRVIGFARRPWSTEFFRETALDMLADFAGADEEQKKRFVSNLDYIQSTFDDDKGYTEIDDYSDGITNRIYYLSTPPGSYHDIIERLGSHGLAKRDDGYVRIVVEKPFGHDLSSAQKLNSTLGKWFDESQIYRIDHYLGKETVQNIMLFRFGNGMFEPVWNNKYIDHIQITAAEKIGVGTRGNYYEKSGTLRDMVQNHMLQLLSLTTMEPPNDLSADSIRGEKVKILRAIKPITYKTVKDFTVRGQYASGVVDGEQVPGYREEDKVDPESDTETFVALKVFLDTWRWGGVPIFLRTGKRLTRKATEIAVQFKEPPHQIFRNNHPSMNRNTLTLRLQPQEGMTLNLNAKVPGYSAEMRPVNMEFNYGSAFGDETPDAYERLIFDAIFGDSTLYTRRDEIEASWTFITRIHEGWRRSEQHVVPYVPGSSGPEEAKALISGNGRRWRKL